MDSSEDILAEKWHELKGQVRQQWANLTDDDFASLNGKTEELSSVLQERYGYGKDRAEMEISTWMIYIEKRAKKARLSSETSFSARLKDQPR